ncbi:XRE family transcriptional regulator [Actinomadura logoneensis]|uniref:XRE family transcriptional regulator n=1 Tax=Actinomadura logoneensis TaxID=2293572 RepID=A0A372JHG3_9ACTN|nr:helix-turn-helix transcriptional regulator [Actinomadura logoneensis]RFU39437.1 XRE family transcriptional regulator [Actinomadura logoneensis]
MPSPYVRRRRLATALRRIREDRDLTAGDLARLVYSSRTKITRFENAQVRPDVGEVMNMLDVLGVEGRRHDELVRLARDAAQKGWWDRFGDSMGPRQKLYADLESGAASIREYNQTGMPAALQTPEFIQALTELDAAQGPLTYRPERMAEARAHRQRHLLGSDGPTYATVLDEVTIHRLAVPRPVMAAQIRHLITAVSTQPRITVQVLRYNSKVPEGLLSKASFSLYTFDEPGDPPLAVVDTVTTDLILGQRNEVARYTGVYERLRKAALPPADSLTFLNEVADRLSEQTGSEA